MANDVQSPPEPSVPTPVSGTIANDGQGPPERSVTTLVSGIIADAQQLIQQQFAMFRQEIPERCAQEQGSRHFLAVGVGITLVGSVLLLLMLSLLLHWAVPEPAFVGLLWHRGRCPGRPGWGPDLCRCEEIRFLPPAVRSVGGGYEGESEMDNEPEVTREQMEETRGCPVGETGNAGTPGSRHDARRHDRRG